jgi:Predicted integral membrane protein (DUF2269)
MDAYRTVLYVHLLSLLVGFAAATVMAVCAFRLRAAQTLAEAVPWGMLAGETKRVFPVAIIGLFATGAYMTSDVWTWDSGWIDVSIVGLAVMALQGPLVGGARAKLLGNALKENGPGPLGEQARARARDRALWIVTFTNPAIALGVIWNMVNKPGVGEAIAAVAVAYLVGAAATLPFTRRIAAIEAPPVAEPVA